MRGLGTIVNAIAIIVGGLLGLAFRSFIEERYQETIIKILGFATMVMALGSILAQMLVVTITGTGDQMQASLNTQGTMMMIISLALGALIGEFLNLDKWFEVFGTWLRDKTGNQKDNQFIDGFVTSTLTVCIGAMAILGAIQDGISGNHDTLFAKAILDMLIIMMMTASMGKGCIFSAIPVFVLQGSITILATLIEPIMTEMAISNITLVGNVLIVCVGVNLVWPKTIRVANVLPAIIIAILFAVV
jgi:hypothetical protein